jgi:hypothetical protein
MYVCMSSAAAEVVPFLTPEIWRSCDLIKPKRKTFRHHTTVLVSGGISAWVPIQVPLLSKLIIAFFQYSYIHKPISVVVLVNCV